VTFYVVGKLSGRGKKEEPSEKDGEKDS